jgi:hypothetical protein
MTDALLDLIFNPSPAVIEASNRFVDAVYLTMPNYDVELSRLAKREVLADGSIVIIAHDGTRRVCRAQ